MTLNETHDPALESWVPGAERGDFPIQNLPFGVFRRRDSAESYRGGVAIGDRIVDLSLVAAALSGDAAGLARVAGGTTLNDFLALGPQAWSALRLALSRALRRGGPQRLIEACLVDAQEAELALPVRIGDYTDFYTSIHHATSVGRMFRPDNPLLPNYKWVPIGYHGRASSIGASGQSFHRPSGQVKPPDASAPTVGPSRRLDYELELGAIIGTPNPLGTPVPIEAAEAQVFGLALFNDWSARDLQAWEYQPLGPFLAKSFASTLSPWLVTLEALAPFRSTYRRPHDDPEPLPYLDSPRNRDQGAIDVALGVWLQTERMRSAGHAGDRLSASNYRDAYWTLAQLVAHHTVNGCNLQTGDLLATGTLSGPQPNEAGSLLELSGGGKQPVKLSSGETRTFLEDGDTVILRGRCKREGATAIGFGTCSGTVLAARDRRQPG